MGFLGDLLGGIAHGAVDFGKSILPFKKGGKVSNFKKVVVRVVKEELKKKNKRKVQKKKK